MNHKLRNTAKNKEAFEALLNIYKPFIISMARRYSICQSDIDDFFQEGQILLYTCIQYLPEKFEPYFKSALRNKFIGMYRKQCRNRDRSYIPLNDNHVGLDENAQVKLHSANICDDPEKRFLNKEFLEQIRHAKYLSSDQKVAVFMNIAGYNLEDIAMRLGKKYSAAATLLSRAKQRIRLNL